MTAALLLVLASPADATPAVVLHAVTVASPADTCILDINGSPVTNADLPAVIPIQPADSVDTFLRQTLERVRTLEQERNRIRLHGWSQDRSGPR